MPSEILATRNDIFNVHSLFIYEFLHVSIKGGITGILLLKTLTQFKKSKLGHVSNIYVGERKGKTNWLQQTRPSLLLF